MTIYPEKEAGVLWRGLKYTFCLSLLKVTECLIGRARLASLFPMSCNRCDAPPRVHWLPETRGLQAHLLGTF